MTRLVAVAVTLVVAGCGARSELDLGEEARSGRVDGGRRDAGADAGGGLLRDAGRDSGLARPCATDADCDDGVTCTTDVCSVGSRCEHVTIDMLCTDSDACTVAERCDAALGCVSEPIACDDGDPCTEDFCDAALGSCNARPSSGTECHFWAHDEHWLHDVDPLVGLASPVFRVHESLTDLAVAPDGTMYGATWRYFGRIELGGSSMDVPLVPILMVPGELTALVMDGDAALYAGSDAGIFRIDLAASSVTFVAPVPPGMRGVGDLELVSGRLFGTAWSDTTTDLLFEVDVAAGTTRVIGDLGVACMWAIVFVGIRMQGVACDANLYDIDLTTGRATFVRGVGVVGWGASPHRR